MVTKEVSTSLNVSTLSSTWLKLQDAHQINFHPDQLWSNASMVLSLRWTPTMMAALKAQSSPFFLNRCSTAHHLKTKLNKMTITTAMVLITTTIPMVLIITIIPMVLTTTTIPMELTTRTVLHPTSLKSLTKSLVNTTPTTTDTSRVTKS